MHFQHATIWLGRDRARVVLFEEQRFPRGRFERSIELRPADPCERGPAAWYLDDVCRAIGDVPQLLLTGTPEAVADFERHAAERQLPIARRIIGVQHVQEPTDERLSALACWHFTTRAAIPRSKR
jgi:hypothetical protein